MDLCFWGLIAVTVVLLAASGVAWWVVRGRRAAEQEKMYFKCPHCKRRLRISRRYAGQSGQCPRCLKPVTFPQA